MLLSARMRCMKDNSYCFSIEPGGMSDIFGDLSGEELLLYFAAVGLNMPSTQSIKTRGAEKP